MKKKTPKKSAPRPLTLGREAIATLTHPVLDVVRGGVRCVDTGSNCPTK